MRARHPGVRSHALRLTAVGASASLLLLVAGCGKSGSSTNASGDDGSTGVDVASSSAPVASSSAAAAGQTPGLTPAKGSKTAPQAAASAKTSGQATSAGTKSGSGGSSTGGAASAAPSSAAQPGPQGIAVNTKCRKSASSVGNGVALKGQKPPPFTGTTLDCGQLDSAAYTNGKPTLVTFFAAWCEPCHKEAKDLEAVYQEHHASKGFQVIGVDTQDESGNPSWFYNNAHWTFPSVWDDGEKIEKAWNSTGVISTLPASFWIHPDGTISSTVIGEMSRSQMEDEFNKL